MSHDECAAEKLKEPDPTKKFDLYFYLDRASERVAAWPPEQRAAINYIHDPDQEKPDLADTFDRIL